MFDKKCVPVLVLILVSAYGKEGSSRAGGLPKRANKFQVAEAKPIPFVVKGETPESYHIDENSKKTVREEVKSSLPQSASSSPQESKADDAKKFEPKESKMEVTLETSDDDELGFDASSLQRQISAFNLPALPESDANSTVNIKSVAVFDVASNQMQFLKGNNQNGILNFLAGSGLQTNSLPPSVVPVLNSPPPSAQTKFKPKQIKYIRDPSSIGSRNSNFRASSPPKAPQIRSPVHKNDIVSSLRPSHHTEALASTPRAILPLPIERHSSPESHEEKENIKVPFQNQTAKLMLKKHVEPSQSVRQHQQPKQQQPLKIQHPKKIQPKQNRQPQPKPQIQFVPYPQPQLQLQPQQQSQPQPEPQPKPQPQIQSQPQQQSQPEARQGSLKNYFRNEPAKANIAFTSMNGGNANSDADDTPVRPANLLYLRKTVSGTKHQGPSGKAATASSRPNQQQQQHRPNQQQYLNQQKNSIQQQNDNQIKRSNDNNPFLNQQQNPNSQQQYSLPEQQNPNSQQQYSLPEQQDSNQQNYLHPQNSIRSQSKELNQQQNQQQQIQHFPNYEQQTTSIYEFNPSPVDQRNRVVSVTETKYITQTVQSYPPPCQGPNDLVTSFRTITKTVTETIRNSASVMAAQTKLIEPSKSARYISTFTNRPLEKEMSSYTDYYGIKPRPPVVEPLTRFVETYSQWLEQHQKPNRGFYIDQYGIPRNEEVLRDSWPRKFVIDEKLWEDAVSHIKK